MGCFMSVSSILYAEVKKGDINTVPRKENAFSVRGL